jgi:hypothetical protein
MGRWDQNGLWDWLGGVYWIRLAQDRDRWLALWMQWWTFGFLRHGVSPPGSKNSPCAYQNVESWRRFGRWCYGATRSGRQFVTACLTLRVPLITSADMMAYSLVEAGRRFRGSYCLHHQDDALIIIIIIIIITITIICP